MADDDIQLPPVDSAGLQETAAAIRQVMARGAVDPTSPYFGRQDRIAASEARVKAAFDAAGVSDQGPPSVEQINAASFRLKEMPAGLVSTIDQLAAAAVERAGGVKQATDNLRQQIGEVEFSSLVEDAKIARADLGGAAGDLHALRLLAAQGRYLAHARTPGRK